jgi:hypothetical protein
MPHHDPIRFCGNFCAPFFARYPVQNGRRYSAHYLLGLLLAFAALSVIHTASAATTASTAGAPVIAGCTVFAADNIWNTAIDKLPLDSNSAAYIESIGIDQPIHADFGAGLWEGGPIGIPYVVISDNQPGVLVAFEVADESDPGLYPIPSDAPIEGGDMGDGDRHVLVLEKNRCLLYELYSAFPELDGSWRAYAGARFDLKSHTLRPDTWTSADAAGLPILPGLVRYEEIAAGEINHAMRFTAPQTRQAHVWPARHHALELTDSRYPPMGQRFRLKADFDVASFSPATQIILRAMKKYGIILADNGSPWHLSGAPDERWNNQALRELHRLQGGDFEAVDVSSLMVDADSGQVRSSAPSPDDTQAPIKRVYLPMVGRG